MSDETSELQEIQPPTRGIRIVRLRLRGSEIDYEVDFRDPETSLPRSMSVVAGAFSTGKTSVLEFVDYCLGSSAHPRHPEILRKVRAALLEVELSGEPHVIERAVGDPSSHAFIRTGSLDEIEVPPMERRPIRPPGDPRSLSSLLLSHCKLEGVQLKEAPTKSESDTDPLSFRDLMWLCFLPNERLDDKNLLFESAHMKNLKLRQVIDVVFDVHDDRSVELGRRVKELERRLSHARTEYTSAQAFVDEQQLGTRLQVELLRDQAETALVEISRTLADLDAQIRATSDFATGLRSRHQEAALRARQAAAILRDRDTQLRRMIPLRAQYADDISKLTMLAEARTLFDPLRLQVCPACLNRLADAPHITDNHCSLCASGVLPLAQSGENASANGSRPTNSTHLGEDAETEPTFDVGSELRATKARLTEITQYVEALDAELPQLRAAADSASRAEAVAARALDRATLDAVSPFLSQRDELMRRKEASTSSLERARTGIKLLDSVDRRAATVTRLETQVSALRDELQDTAVQPDRDSIIRRISERYASILTAWRYPKIGEAFIDTKFVPHMRGDTYEVASSGGRTLISLAWMLAIFEVAWETSAAHPGFLMIDSPQKNLGQGGNRDAEFADSVAVADFYQHLHTWLAGPGRGAQVFVVDNSPPASADSDVVVRFSRKEDQPPYGLVSDETA
ncbi:hypothetical protein SAMN04488074_12865 [Lentzea albidocapillata subsp. violacea]|uniref:DNA recombination protein RecN n=1 Tax=Lentzea albidocapillata subsp. violacea TaxID=128104 RepID=A0A1G9WTE6_9PSEU|nr:DNA recombination protein RecN [Lentzea albidocapillata]SDM87403.1 hypothetical protein SAMN04488074_12865 [Lentzea albidocapillata subsp. violacea]